jgi:hypothetical protein
MRRRGAELLGIGHPLIDALLTYLQGGRFPGEASRLSAGLVGVEGEYSIRYLIEAQLDDGSRRAVYENVIVGSDGSWTPAPARCDVQLLPGAAAVRKADSPRATEDLRQRIERGQADAEARLRAEVDHVRATRARVVGVAALEP